VTESDGAQDPECHPKNLLQCQLDRDWTPAGHPSLTYANTVVNVSSCSQHAREAWLTIQPVTPHPMRRLSSGVHSNVHTQKDDQAGPGERDRHRGPKPHPCVVESHRGKEVALRPMQVIIPGGHADIYFLLALRAHPVRRLCDEGLQPGSRLHVARNLKSLAKDAKDAVTRITLQPTLPNMSTPCPITRKGTPLAYPQPSLGATADPLSMLLRTRRSPVPRVMIIPRCHCQKWSGSCNFIDYVAQPCLDHGRIIRSRLPDISSILYATISTDSSIHRILLSFVAVGTVPIGH
jgi:hypothetical protein